jgi:hypothetical protein
MASGTDCLHLLSIDLGSAPSSLRAALLLSDEDVEHWLGRAAAAGVTLAIVCGPDSVDLYSTASGRHHAFKPLLQSLWALGRNLDGFDRVRTVEASGHQVVTHLMQQAAGLQSGEHGISYSSAIDQAYSLAALNGTLSPDLQELFELASITAHRCRAETQLSAPHSTRASRQVEMLGAERIMEEELTAFMVSAANDQGARAASLPPPASLTPRSVTPRSVTPRSVTLRAPSFAPHEPGSAMRLRATPALLVNPLLRRSS